jgi:DNA polymerase III alpha subunit
MPEEYKDLDIETYVLQKCAEQSEFSRVNLELTEFKKRGMYPVLNFLVYLVDVCNTNNVVLGVGRGSSVASYVLYLIGIHKVDSIKYDLDIKEFLK